MGAVREFRTGWRWFSKVFIFRTHVDVKFPCCAGLRLRMATFPFVILCASVLFEPPLPYTRRCAFMITACMDPIHLLAM